MTFVEIEARKAWLVKQILTEINTEEAVIELTNFLNAIRDSNPQMISPELLQNLMARAEEEDEHGEFMSVEEMDEEIRSW